MMDGKRGKITTTFCRRLRGLSWKCVTTQLRHPALLQMHVSHVWVTMSWLVQPPVETYVASCHKGFAPGADTKVQRLFDEQE